jgi:hypothetical protein
LLGYGTAAAVAVAAATAAEAAASFFSIFSVWLVFLSDVLSSCDAESDIVSGENCESKVFAERKIDERLTPFPSTDLAGYFNDLQAVLGLFGVGPPVHWNMLIFRSPLSLLGVQSLHFSLPDPEIVAQPEPSK